MNERIKQLALDAGLLNYVDLETPKRYFICGNVDLEEVERFARSIVRECADFVDDWEMYQIEMSHRVHGVIPPTGGSNKLKQHFGVEE